VQDLIWSPTEKKVARRAFDLALQKELNSVISDVKRRAAKIERPEDLWKLESYLSECRKEIDGKYDYRYSVLPMVFARLLRDGHLTEEELRGLGDEKLRWIRGIAAL
jgi:hypothetical protein